MINENIKATGELKIVLRDKDGNIKYEKNEKNLVVSVGKEFIASRMIGTADNVMSHMAVGTNNTTPASGHTALLGEIGRAALVSSTTLNNVVTYSAMFAAGVGTGALTEAEESQRTADCLRANNSQTGRNLEAAGKIVDRLREVSGQVRKGNPAAQETK